MVSTCRENNSNPWHVLDLLNMSSPHNTLRHTLAADEVLHVVHVHDEGHCPDLTAAVDLLFDNSRIHNQSSTEHHNADTARMLLKSILRLGWQGLRTSSSKLCIRQDLSSLILHVGPEVVRAQQPEDRVHCPLFDKHYEQDDNILHWDGCHLITQSTLTNPMVERRMLEDVTGKIPFHVQHPLGKQQLHAFGDESRLPLGHKAGLPQQPARRGSRPIMQASYLENLSENRNSHHNSRTNYAPALLLATSTPIKSALYSMYTEHWVPCMSVGMMAMIITIQWSVCQNMQADQYQQCRRLLHHQGLLLPLLGNATHTRYILLWYGAVRPMVNMSDFPNSEMQNSQN